MAHHGITFPSSYLTILVLSFWTVTARPKKCAFPEVGGNGCFCFTTFIMQTGESGGCCHSNSFLHKFLSDTNLTCTANSTSWDCAHCRSSPGSFPNLTPNPTGTEAQESPGAEDFTKELCSKECVLVPLVQCGHCPPAALINSPKLLLKGISQDFLEQHKILLHIMLLHISHSAYTGIVSHADKMCHFYDKQPRNNNSSIF